MDKKKKILVAGIGTLVVIAFIALVVVPYYSRRGRCGDSLKWVYDGEGTLTISGVGMMKDYSVGKLPKWIRFYNEIEKVVIEEGVTSVGDYAFSSSNIVGRAGYGGYSFTKVELPTTLLSIGKNAFCSCKNLKSIALPVKVNRIDDYAFQCCANLRKFNMTNNVMEIGNGVFYACPSLNEVKLSERLQTMGEMTFTNCLSLESISIPESVKRMGVETFNGCVGLKTVWFEGDVPFPEGTYKTGWYDTQFKHVEATAYYPGNNVTWKDIAEKMPLESIVWIPYGS